MAKKPTRAAVKKAPAPKLQEAGGAEAKAEGAAASDTGTEAKASEDKVADAADPAGTPSAPAVDGEQSREQTEAATAAIGVAEAEGEKQPEEAAQPPVAGTAVDPPASGLVVRVKTVGKKSRRRIGRAFGPEPVEIPIEELSGEDQAALIADPRLVVETVER